LEIADMPIHDWSRVDAGLFHDFHQSWIVALRNGLNSGLPAPLEASYQTAWHDFPAPVKPLLL
jgi:hypothetical protein